MSYVDKSGVSVELSNRSLALIVKKKELRLAFSVLDAAFEIRGEEGVCISEVEEALIGLRCRLDELDALLSSYRKGGPVEEGDMPSEDDIMGVRELIAFLAPCFTFPPDCDVETTDKGE